MPTMNDPRMYARSVSLSQRHWRELDALARERGSSVSAEIRRLLDRAMGITDADDRQLTIDEVGRVD